MQLSAQRLQVATPFVSPSKTPLTQVAQPTHSCLSVDKEKPSRHFEHLWGSLRLYSKLLLSWFVQTFWAFVSKKYRNFFNILVVKL